LTEGLVATTWLPSEGKILGLELEEWSFSQHAEEVYALERFFWGQTRGSFVELGAVDGEIFSNTLGIFERILSWRGACAYGCVGVVCVCMCVCVCVCVCKILAWRGACAHVHTLPSALDTHFAII
jgi:hypothetical protein